MTKYEDTEARWKQDVERRLRIMETATRAANTSISDEDGNEVARFSRDGVTLFDADGNTVARLGAAGVSTFDPGDGLPRQVSGSFSDGVTSFTGWVLYDGDGKSVLMTRNDKPGLIKPDLSLSLVQPVSTTTTSGSFVTLVEAEHRRLYHDTVLVSLAAATDVGTTGELRLREVYSGAVTSALTIPSGGNGTAVFRWLHGRPIGDDPGADAFFVLEARRASGAGNLLTYPPRLARLTSSALVIAAASNGGATFS